MIAKGTDDDFGEISEAFSVFSDEIKVRVAEAETKMIWRSKILFLFIILSAASGSALAVFNHTHKLEEEHFHYSYEKAVVELRKVSQIKANDMLEWAISVSSSITSNTLALNRSWPMVTVPYFDRLGSHMIEKSSAHYAAICPLVTEDQRQEWEEWSAQNAANWMDNRAQNQTFTSSFVSPQIFANFSVCTPEKLLIADFDEDNVLNLSEYKNFLQDLGGETCDIDTAFNEGILLQRNWNVLKCLCPNETDMYSSYSSGCCKNNDFQLSTNNETLHRVCRVLDRSIYQECKDFPVSESVEWVHDKKLSFEDDQGMEFNPVWQVQPVTPEIVNLDLLSTNIYAKLTPEVRKTRLPALSGPTLDSLDPSSPFEQPVTYVAVPITDSFEDDSVVAILSTAIPWHNIFKDLLPKGTIAMFAVLRSTCSQQQDATYIISGQKVIFRGMGDIHDPTYDHMKMSARYFEDLSNSNSSADYTCSYSVDFYPLAKCSIVQSFTTNLPLFNAIIVFMIFLVTSLLFLFYDYMVKRRQAKVMRKVEQSDAIVNSVFPEHVRDRLLENTCQELKTNQSSRRHIHSDEMQNEESQPVASKPIADLFPHATVMIADICDFSVWSSMRDASQVFTLLEHIYSAFDELAKRHRVFKVETNSDCYVGVSGLPTPRMDHAVVMAKFAHRCRIEMNLVVKSLGIQLGPDTCDLTMRFGLHSGPITAGVLRGEKSRFQLFGDTVNTAYRISSSCERNMIQVSQETANLLIAANKEAWVSPRESLVDSKGKGPIQTYWLTVTKEKQRSDAATQSSRSVSSDSGGAVGLQSVVSSTEDDKTKRLIGYMADVLQNQLKKIVAMRQEKNMNSASIAQLQVQTREGETVLNEVMEVIPMLVEAKAPKIDPETVQLPPAVKLQIQDYVRSIAAMYKNNSFHNFEHAGHVTQSLVKLLSRIVTKDSIDYENMAFKKKCDVQLHEFTYGITSDPIIDFACVFSALIHDADHPGIPNGQMIKEGDSRAERYSNKSIAEQNSVDLAWNLLMEPSYSEFRACIYETQEELDRFRRLVVNSVMATDIADKELSALRKNRWKKAFDASASELMTQEDINRKATIVIEHLIQAADVSHTMQHWNIYLKWNERLFHELYGSYLEGRGTDPSEMWYKGELGFFDFYLIPLTKKLKECGVFGVTSDEYLNYAQANRREWEHKGESIVAGYLEQYNEKQSEGEEQCINPPTSICDCQSVKKCGVSAATA